MTIASNISILALHCCSHVPASESPSINLLCTALAARVAPPTHRRPIIRTVMSALRPHVRIADDSAQILQLANDIAQLAHLLDTELIQYVPVVSEQVVVQLMRSTGRLGSMQAPLHSSGNGRCLLWCSSQTARIVRARWIKFVSCQKKYDREVSKQR